MSELLALLEDREVGVVRQTRGRLTFTYAESWRAAPNAFPVSLSMPLTASEHPHAAIDAFLWGLLPDNEFVLRRWSQRFHVSPRSAFALIGEVGEDCAGAIRFARPERRDAMAERTEWSDIAWLTEADVANRLRDLRLDASAWRLPRDAGQFSLAGAQPKTALFFDGQRWGVPSGRLPTTHILKPPAGNLDGHAENEHLCLALARALGFPAVRSEVCRFEDETAIVVERYDRVHVASRLEAPLVTRVHQEDFCQALGLHPSRKYQNDGGPGPTDIVNLLRAQSTEARRSECGASPESGDDAAVFLDALILNWLIGGTDAHAKNYAILLGGGGAVRLAPLYDLASALAYPDMDPAKARLAMRIGGEYRMRNIGMARWRKLAAEVKTDEDALIDRIRAMAGELPDRLADEIRRLSAAGITHPVIDTLAHALPRRAAGVTHL